MTPNQERSMKSKKTFLILVLTLAAVSAHSVELVCDGYRQRDPYQRKVVVDCDNRDEALAYLLAAFRLIREKQFPTYMEDMCWRPYNTIKEYPPQAYQEGMANSFFGQCNQALSQID